MAKRLPQPGATGKNDAADTLSALLAADLEDVLQQTGFVATRCGDSHRQPTLDELRAAQALALFIVEALKSGYEEKWAKVRYALRVTANPKTDIGKRRLAVLDHVRTAIDRYPHALPAGDSAVWVCDDCGCTMPVATGKASKNCPNVLPDGSICGGSGSVVDHEEEELESEREFIVESLVEALSGTEAEFDELTPKMVREALSRKRSVQLVAAELCIQVNAFEAKANGETKRGLAKNFFQVLSNREKAEKP